MSDQKDLFGSTPAPSFGTQPHKLHRREGPDTSVAAAYRVDSAGDEARVYRLIAAAKNGLTTKEVAARMGKESHQVSGRLSALQEKGLIVDSGKRRDRSRVMVIAPVGGGDGGSV